MRPICGKGKITPAGTSKGGIVRGDRKTGQAMNPKSAKKTAGGTPGSAADPRRAIRRLNVIGLAVVFLLVVGVGGWAAHSELAGAVIAPGVVVVESNVKKVQHPNGGIVGEILVKEGSIVEEGQIVLRLDDTVPRSTLGVLRAQLDELIAREARLLAERDGLEAVAFPEDLLRRRAERSVSTALGGEEKLFDSRRTSRIGQRAQLRERVAQVNEEIGGLSAQLAGKV